MSQESDPSLLVHGPLLVVAGFFGFVVVKAQAFHSLSVGLPSLVVYLLAGQAPEGCVKMLDVVVVDPEVVPFDFIVVDTETVDVLLVVPFELVVVEVELTLVVVVVELPSLQRSKSVVESGWAGSPLFCLEA